MLEIHCFRQKMQQSWNITTHH